MNELPVALYRGAIFDTNVAALPAVNIEQLPAIWCYCSSPEYHDAVRANRSEAQCDQRDTRESAIRPSALDKGS